MKNLLSFKYWFNLDPSSFIYFAQVFLFSFLLFLFILAILSMFYKRKSGPYKFLAIKLYEFSFINLFLGSLLFFFDYQNIYFLSARFWFLFWIAAMIYWLLNIYQLYQKNLKNRKEFKNNKDFKKYLP